jgi:hypothetical protein
VTLIIDDTYTAAVGLAEQSDLPVAVAVIRYETGGQYVFASAFVGLPEDADFTDPDVQEMASVATCVAAHRYGRRAIQEVFSHGTR